MTPYDRSGTLWTRKVPTLTTLIRIAKLAAGTLNILTSQFLSSIPKDHFTVCITHLMIHSLLPALRNQHLSHENSIYINGLGGRLYLPVEEGREGITDTWEPASTWVRGVSVDT